MKYLLSLCLSCLIGINANAQTANLLVGTYTQKGSKGIYLYHLDTATGLLKEISHTDSASNPSYLAISRDKQFVYAVNEDQEGGISAFALNTTS